MIHTPLSPVPSSQIIQLRAAVDALASQLGLMPPHCSNPDSTIDEAAERGGGDDSGEAFNTASVGIIGPSLGWTAKHPVVGGFL